MAAYSLAGRTGAWLLWTIGASLAAVAVSSGLIAWAEFAKNPMSDAERGEWTNKMLFYALVFTASLFVGFLYLPTLVRPLEGNFVLVDFTVENRGSEAMSVSDIGLYVYDNQNREFETETEGSCSGVCSSHLSACPRCQATLVALA